MDRRVVTLFTVLGLTLALPVSSPAENDGNHPCSNPQPRGHAYGWATRCAPGSGSAGIAKGDFNGDGYGDLAIGVPYDITNFGTLARRGAVHVVYGSDNGVRDTDPNKPSAQTFHPLEPLEGQARTGDRFGSGLAAGDFDGDGYSDLAIGAPGGTDVGTNGGAGYVTVYFGSPTGIDPSHSLTFNATLFSAASAGDSTLQPSEFGNSLAWGNFNGDAFGDLAIEVHADNSATSMASVIVLFGSDGNPALSSQRRQQLNYPGDVFRIDGMHFADIVLTAGDFNRSGGRISYSDLAVGSPYHDVGSAVDAGGVYIHLGSGTGLQPSGAALTQNTSGIPGTAQGGDYFGAALAAGNFDGDGNDDLAIGVPNETVADTNGVNRSDAGVVTVIRGSAGGLDNTTAREWSQASSGVPGDVEAGDHFGAALAAGDFNGDGKKDLAIGVPSESIGSVSNAGAVNVIYGGVAGLSATAGPGSQMWSQNSTDIAGSAETDDRFGSSLTAWDFGRTSQADLAIGVPGEDIAEPGTGNKQTDAGAVNVIYGSTNGLAASGNNILYQGLPNTFGLFSLTPRNFEYFGEALY